MVVCVFKTLWLCKASGDGEQFHPSFVLLVVFKILGCPSVVLLFLFSNSCPHLAMMERNFVQVLFFFFFFNLRLSTTSGDGEGTRCGGDGISRRGRSPH